MSLLRHDLPSSRPGPGRGKPRNLVPDPEPEKLRETASNAVEPEKTGKEALGTEIVREARRELDSPAFWRVAGIVLAVTVIVSLLHVRGRGKEIDPLPAPDAPGTIGAEFDSLVERVGREEGFSPKHYEDARGTWSIGYGFNSGGPFTAEQKSRWYHSGISKAEADSVLRSTLDRIVRVELPAKWPVVDSLPWPVHLALGDAAYQLGVNGLTRLDSLHVALELRDPELARRSIESYAWYSQTQNRAENLIRVIESEFRRRGRVAVLEDEEAGLR